MDCEKFDRVVLDLLYDELDELTSAAARRHMEHCSRCRGIGSRLRATREVGILPLVPAPEGLSERILEAEQRARSELGLRQRFGRAVSILAGYAMRPQLAMAALFMLMIGASLLFLRARPGDRDSVHVTERGVPEGETDPVAVVPLPEKSPVTDSARGRGRGLDESARRDKGSPSEAEPSAVAEQAAAPSPSVGSMGRAGYDDSATANAASAALSAALSVKKTSGCARATPLLEEVGQKFPGTYDANEATLQLANCQRNSGNLAEAKKNYEALTNVDAFADRARQSLAEMDQSILAARKARSAPAAAPPPAKAAAKAGATAVSQ